MGDYCPRRATRADGDSAYTLSEPSAGPNPSCPVLDINGNTMEMSPGGRLRRIIIRTCSSDFS